MSTDNDFLPPKQLIDPFQRSIDYLRAHGPFEPHRLPLEEMEYTTMPTIAKKLTDRWQPLD